MKKPNLLILGAGQYGSFVKELAQSIEKYSSINFLDDKQSIAIGNMSEIEKFSSDYQCAIVAIGNPDVRLQLYEKIHAANYFIPTLISKQAFVSPSAIINEGTIVEPFAVVQSNAKIGKCCFISSGAVIKHNAIVEDFCYIDCNSVVSSDERVAFKTKKRDY